MSVRIVNCCCECQKFVRGNPSDRSTLGTCVGANCKRMPETLCRALDVPAGSPFSAGVLPRALRAITQGPSASWPQGSWLRFARELYALEDGRAA